MSLAKSLGVTSGRVIRGEIETNDWDGILDIVKQCKPHMSYVQHIEYIEERIAMAKRYARSEHKDLFLDTWYD